MTKTLTSVNSGSSLCGFFFYITTGTFPACLIYSIIKLEICERKNKKHFSDYTSHDRPSDYVNDMKALKE